MTKSTYVRVFDNLSDHPKWLAVSPAGVGLWVLSLGYCSRNRTDGHFPAVLVNRWGIGDDVAPVDELLGTGRWHETGHDCDDCPQPVIGELYVHAYLDHQRSREEIEGVSVLRAEAGRLGGKARAVKQLAKQNASNGKQNASKSKPTTDTTTTTEQKTPATADASADFEKFWKLYPKRIGKLAAERAFAKALKTTDVPTIAAALHAQLPEWTDPKFIPHPATWLNQGRWADELAPVGLDALPPPPSGDLYGNFSNQWRAAE